MLAETVNQLMHGILTLVCTALVLSAVQPLAAQDATPAKPLLVVEGIILGPASPAEFDMVLKATRAGPESLEIIPGPLALEQFGEQARAGAITITLRPGPARPVRCLSPLAARPANPLLLVNEVPLPLDSTTLTRLHALGTERMDVYRSTVAQALYGTRACAGVVVVTARHTPPRR